MAEKLIKSSPLPQDNNFITILVDCSTKIYREGQLYWLYITCMWPIAFIFCLQKSPTDINSIKPQRSMPNLKSKSVWLFFVIMRYFARRRVSHDLSGLSWCRGNSTDVVSTVMLPSSGYWLGGAVSKPVTCSHVTRRLLLMRREGWIVNHRGWTFHFFIMVIRTHSSNLEWSAC